MSGARWGAFTAPWDNAGNVREKITRRQNRLSDGWIERHKQALRGKSRSGAVASIAADSHIASGFAGHGAVSAFCLRLIDSVKGSFH